MDAIATALKDILKFKAVSYINTGDKTLDNLCNTFVLAAITYVFAGNLFWSIYYWGVNQFYKWVPRPKRPTINTTFAQMQSYIPYLTSPNMLRVTWQLSDSDNYQFTNGFIQYLLTLGVLSSRHVAWINMKTLQPHKTYDFAFVRDNLFVDKLVVIFIDSKGHPLAISRTKDDIVFIICEFQSTFIEFREKVSMNVADNGLSLNVVEFNANDTVVLSNQSCIYLDRTFDKIVSRHKASILQSLENFQSNFKNGANFHGFGVYNFGMILYGKPGTGKTSFIKAICNHLNRSAWIVNMQHVKTAKRFQEIVTNTKQVIVLEEFDCVEGVLSREIESKQTTFVNPLDKLMERQMQLIQMQIKRPEGVKQDATDPLVTELKRVNDEIQTFKNQLTLYSFLTMLDGMAEVRGRVMIATTNHIDRIDPALLRPGRFDLKIKLEECTIEETRELLHLMFKGDENESLINSSSFPDKLYSPIEIINKAHMYKDLVTLIQVLCTIPK
jgi:hypothetical protein